MAVSSLQLVDNLSVATGTPQYSQAVNMNGADAVQATVLVANANSTTLTMYLEGSNDLSNWKDLSAPGSWAGLGAGFSAPAAVSSIAFQYVRVKFTAAAAGPVVCSVYLCTSFL